MIIQGVSLNGVTVIDSGPPPVTAGLVLSLDAGNPASYPGSGTTWRNANRGRYGL